MFDIRGVTNLAALATSAFLAPSNEGCSAGGCSNQPQLAEEPVRVTPGQERVGDLFTTIDGFILITKKNPPEGTEGFMHVLDGPRRPMIFQNGQWRYNTRSVDFMGAES